MDALEHPDRLRSHPRAVDQGEQSSRADREGHGSYAPLHPQSLTSPRRVVRRYNSNSYEKLISH
jgi:hypothetical protein